MGSESLPRDPEAPKRTRDFIDRAKEIFDDLIRNGAIFRTRHGWDIRHSDSSLTLASWFDSDAAGNSTEGMWPIPGQQGSRGAQGDRGYPGRDGEDAESPWWPLQDLHRLGSEQVSLTHSVDQSLNNATQTILQWDTERSDSNGFHSTSTNISRITIPVGMGGVYLFAALVRWSANAFGDRTVVIFKNGFEPLAVQTIVPVASGANTDQLIISAPATLTPGEWVEAYVNQSSGSTLTVVKQGQFSPNFGCVRVSQ